MIGLTDLTSVTVEVTRKCNLNCRWCFTGSGTDHDLEPSFDRVAAMLSAVASSSRHVTLTGGEPFVRADILDLMVLALRDFSSVGVTTNGLTLTGSHIEFLRSHNIPVAVSVDGPGEVHDYVRGQGSYAAVIGIIEFLVQAGIPVSVQTIVSRASLPHVEALAVTMAELGVRILALQRLMPYGRGRDWPDDQLVPADALAAAQVFSRLRARGLGGMKIKSKDPLHHTLIEPTVAAPPGSVVGGCRAGLSALFIKADGSVLACPFLESPVGNILRQSLEEIWLGADGLRVFRRISNYGKCQDCRYWQRCRGCRAFAAARTGDVMGADPLCWHGVEVRSA